MKIPRVNGKHVVTGLVGFTFVFGMAFWWFQEHAFYEENWADKVEIAGVVYPVTQWKGVTSESSPTARIRSTATSIRANSLV